MLQKTMGKNKGARKNANVFKVSTARSNKLKAKAKKVVSNLKKLDLTSKGSKNNNKDKTMTINELMNELYKGMQSQPDKKSDATQKQSVEKNKISLVPKVTPTEMTTAASLVEKMEL